MNKIIIGNWKMYPTLSDSLVLATSLKRRLEDIKGVEVILAPPLPWLVSILESWTHRPHHIHLAAQNLWPEDQGAYTGEISAYLLKDLVKFAIIGHSERRRFAGEDDELIQEKIHACLKWQIRPILCVGEMKKAIDSAGKTDSYQWGKLTDQLMTALTGVKAEDLSKIIIAYEPVWAVGTKNPAPADYAGEIVKRLRARLAEKYHQLAQEITMIYGGSVNSSNAATYLKQPGIDGLLPGMVSVKAKDFIEICRIAASIRSAEHG